MYAKKTPVSQDKRNRQGLVLLRTGVPSLDEVLEGGLPQGCLCLLEEDADMRHWLQITRCFLGEGVLSKHKTFVYSDKEEGKDLLPAIKVAAMAQDSTDQFRIAFRYESFPSLSAVQAPYSFDISKVMDQRIIDQCAPTLRCISTSNEDCYRSLWSTILTDLQSLRSAKDQQAPKRLVIKSLLGSTWPAASLSTVFQLFHSLKTLLRSANAVCIVTCPVSLLGEELRTMMRQTADIVMKCVTVSPDPSTDFTGRMELLKPPRLHSLHNLDLETLSYGLRFQGGGLTVEKLHLPPASEVAPPANASLAF